jgi:hypothetical protein
VKKWIAVPCGALSAALFLNACVNASGTVEVRPPSCLITPKDNDGNPVGAGDSDLSKVIGAFSDKYFDYGPSYVPEQGEVNHDVFPRRKLQFVVRVVGRNGAPLKDKNVIYTYRKKGTSEAAFSESFRTDANGYLLFNQQQEKQITLTGNAMSTTTGTSSTGGVVLGPLVDLGGSSSSTTQSGFSISVRSETPPIVLHGEYAGTVKVAGAQVGSSSISVESTPAEQQVDRVSLGSAHRFVRMGHTVNVDSGNNCSSPDAHGCRDIYVGDELRATRLIYRRGIDPEFTCAHLNANLKEGFQHEASASYVDAEGKAVDCAALEAMQAQITCDADYVDTVWEIQRLDVNL